MWFLKTETRVQEIKMVLKSLGLEWLSKLVLGCISYCLYSNINNIILYIFIFHEMKSVVKEEFNLQYISFEKQGLFLKYACRSQKKFFI